MRRQELSPELDSFQTLWDVRRLGPMLRRSTLMASDMLRLWKNYWRSWGVRISKHCELYVLIIQSTATTQIPRSPINTAWAVMVIVKRASLLNCKWFLLPAACQRQHPSAIFLSDHVGQTFKFCDEFKHGDEHAYEDKVLLSTYYTNRIF